MEVSNDQPHATVVVDVPMHSADLENNNNISTTAITNENIAPTLQRVKSNLLRTSPIISAETKKRKRGADEDDYANAFTDTTNIQSNGDVPLSPGESPTKRRKKMTDEEKAERERQRLEREEKRQQELKEKTERKLKKEEERRLREEERKQKETEREEQRRQREEEKRRKEEEKKKKEDEKEKQRLEREEEKRKREEERKKKEDEKKKKEDEKKKKEEEKERAEEEKKRLAEKKKAYWGQFKASSASEVTAASTSLQSSRELAEQCGSERGWSTELFRAWQPAASAVIAPLHRWQSRDTTSFENQLTAQNGQVSIATLPKRARVTRRSVLAARKARRTQHYQEVIDLSGAADPKLNPLTDRLLHARFKYLNFHENVRPAYYGTCTTQCRRVTGRRPFHKEEHSALDYEYDSDEDWEEEEGEDLDALSDRSEEETAPHTSNNKEETEEDYCYDGEFVVADGYLSDEEGLKSDNDSDDERDPLVSPADLPPKTEEERARDAERRAERMKKMMAHKKRVAECQAVVAGPIYHPSSAEERVRALITCYPVELLATQPIDPRVPLAEELDEEASVPATPKKAKVVPDALVPDLIRILHGASSRTHVIDTFHKLHPHISKRQIERKIVEIASRGQVDDSKQGWVVRPEIVARFATSTSEVLPNLEVKQDRSGDTSTTQTADSSSAAIDTCHQQAMIQ